MYAGRLDRIWLIDGAEHLTDIKTGGKYKQHIFSSFAPIDGKRGTDNSPLKSVSQSVQLQVARVEHRDDRQYGYKMVEALHGLLG